MVRKSYRDLMPFLRSTPAAEYQPAPPHKIYKSRAPRGQRPTSLTGKSENFPKPKSDINPRLPRLRSTQEKESARHESYEKFT